MRAAIAALTLASASTFEATSGAATRARAAAVAQIAAVHWRLGERIRLAADGASGDR
jgi:hypothetical protein